MSAPSVKWMENRICLSGRLGMIAGFISEGAGVVDVGTDHGYIPAFLAQRGGYGRIVAADLRQGPLSRARATAEKAGVAERIEFVCTDGLQGIDPRGLDTVSIAGMGGETIRAILAAAPWTRQNGIKMVLQPQSKQDELLPWLMDAGCAVMNARLVRDAGRLYSVLLVAGGQGHHRTLSPAEIYADRHLLENRDPLLAEYLDALSGRFTNALRGMEKSISAAEPDERERLLEFLRGLAVMREETKKWPK